MSKKTYKTIAIIATIVSIIGLVTFLGGVKPVNVGVFVFPAMIAMWAFYLYEKKK